MDNLLPTEIYNNILSYMSITDLVRVERTCRLFQSFALCEIEKRLIRSGATSDEWGILVSIYYDTIQYKFNHTNMNVTRFTWVKYVQNQFVLTQEPKRPTILF